MRLNLIKSIGFVFWVYLKTHRWMTGTLMSSDRIYLANVNVENFNWLMLL